VQEQNESLRDFQQFRLLVSVHRQLAYKLFSLHFSNSDINQDFSKKDVTALY
jgi:hypothetical protein